MDPYLCNVDDNEHLVPIKRRRIDNALSDSAELNRTAMTDSFQSDGIADWSIPWTPDDLEIPGKDHDTPMGICADPGNDKEVAHSALSHSIQSLPSLSILPDNNHTEGLEQHEMTINNICEHVPTAGAMDENEVVCFGMICGLSATCEQQGQVELPSSFSVQLDLPSRFVSEIYTTITGYISQQHGHMIRCLLEESSLTLYATCNLEQQPKLKKKAKIYSSVPCSVDIIVYGPYDMFDEIGSWFQDYEVYLQDPEICHADAKYCNPHRMSSQSLFSCSLLSEVISKTLILQPQELPEPSDFLDILSSPVDLEESPQPTAIRTELGRHQKQALTFMLNREEGWQFDRKYPDVWEVINTDRGRMFINTVSMVRQIQEPPQFYGGIIADPMGLGKTLTMIALIATDIDGEKENHFDFEDMESSKQGIAATLVIVPPPILGTWEKQLNDHVAGGALIFRLYHGKTRVGLDELSTVHLVLTTYHTVMSEWKSSQGSHQSSLFSVRWRRIVLDEAHYIRNGSSKMATAVCALEAVSRWAVTGTPIQNRLGDLASLLKFIRVHPYADHKRFELDISRLWKSGEAKEAVQRLKRLSTCLLLRRAKATINLPARTDLVYTIDFSHDERQAYESIRQQTIAKIDEALGEESGTRKSSGYVNVLQQIESLRLFSNLGLFYSSRHEKPSHQSSDAEEWSKNAQETFNSQRGMYSITCLQCASALSLTETLFDDPSPKVGTAQYTSCLKFVCIDCAEKLAKVGQHVPCGHSLCSSAPVSTSGIAMEEVHSTTTLQLAMASTAPPSKIKSLVDDVKQHVVTPGVKCVIFSNWRLTLDLIKARLDHEGIQSIRFDGKVPQKDRQSVVEKFETDANIQVMLLTLSCGAVGLTLTAASRAYLTEPHWNPTVEEQALARIHRLGQTKRTTTVRLFMRNSFEEQVMKVQESKKQLANVLLSPQDNKYSDSSFINMLESLRSFL